MAHYFGVAAEGAQAHSVAHRYTLHNVWLRLLVASIRTSAVRYYSRVELLAKLATQLGDAAFCVFGEL